MIFYLVGFMGAGKSSVGREAAKRLGMRFVDTDREVEKMHGMSVSNIFRGEGEGVFRKSERAVLERLSGEDGDVVVATGGGAPCHGDNMELMNAAGKTIYLKLSPPKLLARLLPGQARRPKLNGMDEGQVLGYIGRELPGRERFYGRASMVIDCDALGDDSVCRHVTEYILHFSDGNRAEPRE